MGSRNCTKGQRKSPASLSYALLSAAAEWLLIFLTFVAGIFSYLGTRLARYCKLQTPCLLCSRLDGILGREGPGFYRKLVCRAHKLEISSLVYCHVHQKLANIHEMCESCLLSFAIKKKSESQPEVGKLGDDLTREVSLHLAMPADAHTKRMKIQPEEDVMEVPLPKKDPVLRSPNIGHCSCCDELFHRKSNVQRLLHMKSIECYDILLGQAAHCSSSCENESKETWEMPTMSSSVPQGGKCRFHCLSHVGYTQLKIASDTESELPFSDEDDGSAPVDTGGIKEDLSSQSPNSKHVENRGNILQDLPDDTTPEKLIHSDHTLPDSSHRFLVNEHHSLDDSSVSEVAITRDLGQLDWNEFGRKESPSTPKDLTVQDTKTADKTEVSTTEACVSTTQESDNHPAPPEDKLEVLNSKNGEVGNSDVSLVPTMTCAETPRSSISTAIDLKQIPATNKLSSLSVDHVDLNDDCKVAARYRMYQPSPRESYRAHEHLRSFLAQVAAGRGLEFLHRDLTPIPSPRVCGHTDDRKLADLSSIQQNAGKKYPVERDEYGFESLDGSIIGEIEGESLIDHLKRQIELDRKSLSLLLKELEEERNASAIAANQAMAMITRVQEEKASMQMEALQYQRMMEEQAEYDQEALQQSNDLLTEKEKEIQDLEAEIESYKRQFGENSVTLS